MADLEEVKVDQCSVAPSPVRDYFHLLVTTKQVKLTRWLISHNRRDVPPVLVTVTHSDFENDDKLQADVTRIFGDDMLFNILGIGKEQKDYLQKLPLKCLEVIFNFLQLRDLISLQKVSKSLRKACTSDVVWKNLYEKHFNSDDESNTKAQYKPKNITWMDVFRNQYLKEIKAEKLSLETGDRFNDLTLG